MKLAESLWNAIAEGDYNFWEIWTGNDLWINWYIWYQVKPFKQLDKPINRWSGFLKSFSSIKENIYICSTWNKNDIRFLIWIPSSLKTYFENIYYSYFDTSDIAIINQSPSINNIKFIDWKWWNIYNDSDFTKNGEYLDPRKDILSLYDNIYNQDSLTILFIYKFRGNGKNIISKTVEEISKNPENIDKNLKTEDNKNISLKLSVWFTHKISDSYARQQIEWNIKSAFGKYTSWGVVAFSNSNHASDMNINQAINFFHFLDEDNNIWWLEYALYRKLPYPVNIPDFNNTEDKNSLTIIWTTDYRYEKRTFGIRSEDKLRHMYIVGKTWTWKSKLIANLIKSDMISNKWLCLLDPHGDLVDDVLSQVPSYRINDVVLFDVSDSEWPIWFNVFEYENESEKTLIASWIVGIFKKLYDNSRWPRLEYILRNVILSILEYPNATLLHLVRMLTDNSFKEEVLTHVSDPVILKFWRDEFDKWQPKQKEEAIAPITNKVWQFISSKIMRNIFWQWSTKMNMRKMMDEGKIILMNLSKGKIWEDNANMIWSFVVSKIQIDAMSRADTLESERREFYLYIDEFQNFATDSFETILSEARKYKLWLIVANQFTSQLDEKVRNAIFGNVGTIACMTVWYDDAIIMTNQFKWLVNTNDILSLPSRHAYIRLKIDGKDSDIFSMKTADRVSSQNTWEIKEKVKNQSRQRYAMAREELEKLIKIWAEKKFSPAEKVMEKAKELARQKKLEIESKENIYISNEDESDNIYNLTSNAEDIYTADEIEDNSQASVDETANIIDEDWSIENMNLWERYDGLVKLKYNFGLFVTVLGVEWLLHKNFIVNPEWVNWKKIYNVWDSIKVKLVDKKELEWEIKAIWSQEWLES